MFEIKAIMTTNVISVKRQTSIHEAIRTLVENNITGLPVINDDMTLAGIISEKNILRLLYDFEDTPCKVEDLMTEDVVSFGQEDDLMDVCECLISNNFRRVPVLDDGKLVGIISRKDIIKYISSCQSFFRDIPPQRRQTSIFFGTALPRPELAAEV